MSEKLPESEIAEILPYNIGELSVRESAPLLSRAFSRIDILRPKSEFWDGMKENLRGASAWIDAKKGEISAKTFRAIAGASLVATMVAACAKPPETQYIPTEAPRITEVIPTEAPTQIPTKEPTPTVEPSATPTKIPKYEGPLIDVVQRIGVQGTELNRSHDEQLETDSYNLYTPYPVTLISVWTDPETQISEEVWGFHLNDQDYRFRTRSVIYYPFFENPEPYNPPEGIDINLLRLGSIYQLGLGGYEKPIQGSVFWDIILSAEQNKAGRLLFGSLRTDPADPQRLADFFDGGTTEGFDVDEDGIVDLSGVVSVFQVIPW